MTRNVTPLRHRKRTPSFSINVVDDTRFNQNENNHLAFAGGHSLCRCLGLHDFAQAALLRFIP